MDPLKPGVSSPQVKTMQAQLNKVLPSIGMGKLKENGEYDDTTAQAVAAFNEKANIGHSSQNWDGASQKALDAALDPKNYKKEITVPGKGTFMVTKEEFDKLKKMVDEQAAKQVQENYGKMAESIKGRWDLEDKHRKDNWWISYPLEGVTGSKFPPAGDITNAIKAANDMKGAAAKGTLTEASLGSMSLPIRNASAAMDMYFEVLYMGSDKLCVYLEGLAGACKTTLQVASCFVPGGFAVQVGLGAALGGYDKLLDTVVAASKDPKVTVADVGAEVIKGALIEGAIAAIMKGQGKGVEKFVDTIAEKAIKEVGGNAAKAALKKYAIRAAAGGAKQGIEDALKGLGALLTDPKQKVTPENILKAGATGLVKGAALGTLGPMAEGLSKSASKSIKVKDLVPKDMKLDKTLEAAGGKLIDAIAPKAVDAVLEKWDPKDDPAKFQKEVEEKIEKDKEFQKWIEKSKAKK